MERRDDDRQATIWATSGLVSPDSRSLDCKGFYCEHENYNPNNPVAYTLEKTIEAGSSLYDKGSEPDATPVLVLKNGKLKVENE